MILLRRHPVRLAIVSFFASFLLLTPAVLRAQSKPVEEPVLLEEPRNPPPLKEVRHHTIEKKYDDEKTLRVKIKIVQLSDDSYVNDGPYVEYFENGQKFQEGRFKRGVFVGEWNYWHPSGQLRRSIQFNNGKADGQIELFREDGTLQEIQTYDKGVRKGLWKSFYPDGKTPLMEFTYEGDAGSETGTRIVYYKSGKKRNETSFLNGKRHGKTIDWSEEGKKIAEADYVKGEQGEVIRY